jgi:hypothetical protein
MIAPCPTTSDSFVGRMRSAKGTRFIIIVYNELLIICKC